MHSLLGADLVGQWNFDNEPVTNQFRDLSGGGNTGTCTAPGCPVPVDGVPGTRGTALRFDGVDDTVSIPHSEPLNSQVFGTSDRFTISAWAHPISWVSYGIIINKAIGTWSSNVTNGLWANTSGFQCIMGANVSGNPSGSFIRIIFMPPLNNWHQIVCSADGVTLRMFVNGRLVGSVSIVDNLTHPRTSNNAPVTIGRVCVGCAPSFNGFIDDVRLYSRALTASEIQTLYAQTKDKYLVEE